MTTKSDDRVGRRSFVLGAGALAAAAAPAVALVGAPPAAATSTALLPALTPPRPARPDQAFDPERWETCLNLARDLLLVTPEGEDLKLKYLRILIDEGLPATTQPRDVAIVGAGISGLVAGLLLKRAGHRVRILEANANRIGGRIKTFRKGPESDDAPFSDENLYAEAGAMRLPDFYPLTLALADKLGLQRRLFYNVDVAPGTGNQAAPIPPVVYEAVTGEIWQRGTEVTDFAAPDKALSSLVHIDDALVTRSTYAQAPQEINTGLGLEGEHVDHTTGELLDAALDIARDYYSLRQDDGVRVDRPLQERVEGWARLIYDFDHFSMGRYLREHAGLDSEVVHAIGTLENLESRLALSFIHSFLTRGLVNPRATYWELVGGTAVLPYALQAELADELHMNRRMIRLDQTDEGVVIETTTEAGGDDAVSGEVHAETETFTADVAIVTIPFSALRHVGVSPSFSHGKRRAVGTLHYDSATKVLLEFSRRWWEFTEDDWRRELDAIAVGLYDRYQAADATQTGPIHGGGSVTDSANRFVYYPSHAVEGSEGGVVLASYTWADDADRWDSLHDDERYAYALRGVQQLHGQRVEVFYTGRGKTQSWLRNRYACGEAAVFTPGQFTELHPHIGSVEGRVHFAGEHTSLKHSWIEGALESAVRVALEVNDPS